MNIYILTTVVVFVSVAASSKHYNPCKNVKHGDPKYLKEDPRDCSKFYKCHGQTPHHKDCPDGTSFDPNMNIGHGGCNFPDPSKIPDCYSDDDDGYDDDDDDDNDDDDDDEDDDDDNDDDVEQKGTLGQWSEWSE